HPMRRRAFITLVGSAAAWPLTIRAQQPERIRRIGVLMGFAESDREGQTPVAAFGEALQKLGWADGRNCRRDYPWGAGDVERLKARAVELVGSAPDVIATGGATALAALQLATRSVPVVFIGVTDPVGAGFVENLSRPGGNATGFTQFEYGISGKWL